jgi:integrase
MPKPVARPRVRLTRTSINKLQPEARPYVQWDAAAEGFGVRIYPSGARAYIVVAVHNGRDKLQTLGRVGDFAEPAEARLAAVELRRKLLAGIDPKAEARRARDRLLTLREGFIDYYLVRATKSKESTLIDTCKGLRYSYGHLLDTPVREIDADAVIAAYRKRKAASPTRAALEARYLRAAWNWLAADKPHLELPPCPVLRINALGEWEKPRPRTGRLTPETAPTWWATTAAMLEAGERDGVLFSLLYLTGIRIGEAIGLRWADVHLGAATPFMVLHDTKTRSTVELPLPQQAVSLLRDWPATTPFVFPAVARSGAVVPMPYPSVGIKRHRERCGVAWSPHDLRRTYISCAELAGVPSFIVRRLTNHVANQADAHDPYRVAHLADLAPWAQKVADALERWT